MKWMDQQSKLQTEAHELSSQIGMLELRESLRKPIVPFPTALNANKEVKNG